VPNLVVVAVLRDRLFVVYDCIRSLCMYYMLLRLNGCLKYIKRNDYYYSI